MIEQDLKNLRIDRNRKSGKESFLWRWVVIGLSTVVVLGLSGLVYSRLTAAIEVETARVKRPSQSSSNGGEVILNATGYIIAAHKIEVASKVNGLVAWIGVEKGDKVKEGQVLVRLENDEYRARLLEAQGQLDSLRARLAELKNGSLPEEIARARSDIDQVRADLENADVGLQRTRALVEQGVVARQELDDAQARYRVQAAKISGSEKSYELVREGPRREEIQSTTAQVKQAEGTLAFARTQFENTIIRAPVSGTILERNVEKGEFVTTGFVGDRGAKGYVVSLADLGDLRVELDINQNDFARLGPQQPSTVTTDAYPDRRYEGFIEEISPEANRQKATVQVKVKIQNPDDYLRPEMNASVAFHSAEGVKTGSGLGSPCGQPARGGGCDGIPANRVITIPPSAVRDNLVFVVVDGKAVQRKVQVKGTTSQGAQIESGLVGGEDVILNPPVTLKDGQKVRPKHEEREP